MQWRGWYVGTLSSLGLGVCYEHLCTNVHNKSSKGSDLLRKKQMATSACSNFPHFVVKIHDFWGVWPESRVKSIV